MRRFGIDRFTALLAAIGALAGEIVLLRTNNYGVFLVGDSRLYIEASRNLLDGHGLIGWHGRLMVDAPPLFPLVLAYLSAWAMTEPLFLLFASALLPLMLQRGEATGRRIFEHGERRFHRRRSLRLDQRHTACLQLTDDLRGDFALEVRPIIAGTGFASRHHETLRNAR